MSNAGVGGGVNPSPWDMGKKGDVQSTNSKRLSPEGSGLADDGKRLQVLDVA